MIEEKVTANVCVASIVTSLKETLFNLAFLFRKNCSEKTYASAVVNIVIDLNSDNYLA